MNSVRVIFLIIPIFAFFFDFLFLLLECEEININ